MHLNLTESCAEAGIYATSEAERAYWLSREKSYLTASVEIDVHAFAHDAVAADAGVLAHLRLMPDLGAVADLSSR